MKEPGAKTPANATPSPDKRPRGRPTAAAGAGAFKRVNLSLYDEHLAIAARIHDNTSAAVRLALDFWAQHHPAPRAKASKNS